MNGDWVPLKRIASLNPETLGEDTEPGLEFRYIDISATGRGRLVHDPEPMIFESAPSRARRVLRQGDTILSTVRTYLRAVWMLRDPKADLVASTGFVCLRPIPGIEPRYLGWLAQSDLVVEEVVARSVGVSYPAINPSDLGLIKIPLRAFDEQETIADYLDRETARIDALIAAKQRMCSLLEDRYWAWLDSKIQELASDFLPLRRVMRRITDGPFGSSLKSAHYVDAGARVVRLGNIGRGVFKAADEAFISSDYYAQLSRHVVRQGDLLVAGLGDSANPVGRACVAPDLGAAIVKADCYCAAVDPNVADAEFIALWLSSDGGSQRIAVAGRGTTRTRINLEIAKEIEVPVLPLDEQHQIATEAEQRRKLHEATADAMERQVALLHERRLGLISAAITGQIEIPVAA